MCSQELFTVNVVVLTCAYSVCMLVVTQSFLTLSANYSCQCPTVSVCRVIWIVDRITQLSASQSWVSDGMGRRSIFIFNQPSGSAQPLTQTRNVRSGWREGMDSHFTEGGGGWTAHFLTTRRLSAFQNTDNVNLCKRSGSLQKWTLHMLNLGWTEITSRL